MTPSPTSPHTHPDAPLPTGRRAWLQQLAPLAGAALARQTLARPTPPDPPDVPADIDPGSIIAKLVRRATFGLTEAEAALANALGYDGYLEYQLDHTAIDDAALDALLAPLPTLTMNFNELNALNNIGQIRFETSTAVLLRAIHSRRQLFERVVELWNDHFNINIDNDLDVYLVPTHDRVVIRGNALGRFPELLAATARSPAMLDYLSNDRNSAAGPNENYARELMELHTMGVDAGFTQHDVTEIARCFTGWTWWRWDGGDLNGDFRFDPTRHDDNPKLVLGNVIPAGGGESDGVRVINILADHPATARFIARKLCLKFIGEDCPRSVIDSVASVYTQTGGDIKAMLRAVFRPNVVAAASPRYKRPFHLVASALRVLPVTLNSPAGLLDYLNSVGHHPFYHISPDGFPDTLAHWGDLVLGRWNFGAALIEAAIQGVIVNRAQFFAGLTRSDAMIDRIDTALFGGEMPPAEKNRVHDYLSTDPLDTNVQRESLGLALGSPGFQWY
jgi:uncharacterized protein (DUF1800 family)